MDLSEANDAQAFMSHAWFGPLKFPKPWETNLQTAQHPDWTSELAIELTLPTEGKEEITTPTGVDFQRDAPAVAAQGPGDQRLEFRKKLFNQSFEFPGSVSAGDLANTLFL